MSHALVCASGVELIMDYVEGVLPPDLKAGIEEHMASCERCAAFVASYRETPRIVREATTFEMPKDLEDTLMDFLRRRRTEPDPTP